MGSIPADLLRAVLAVEGVALALLVALLLHATGLASRRRRRRAAGLDRWVSALTPVLDRAGSGETGDPPVREVADREHVLALSAVVDQLSGDVSHRVIVASGGAQAIPAAQRWCRSRLWWRRLRGIRILLRLGGGEHLVAGLLDDPHPEVRAEAAAWVAAHPSHEGIAALVDMLDSDVAWCRFAAQDALLRIGGPATEQLAGYLEGPAARRPEGGLRVATGIASPRLLPAALARSDDPAPPVRAAAAELLAAIGGERATSALVALLADEDARVRASAASGLGVLTHWLAAPDLAAALRDPAWDVRRAAAEALDGLGAVGRLYLRRAMLGTDPFAADVAQLVLDLRDPATEVHI